LSLESGVVKQDYAGLRMICATHEIKPSVKATMALDQHRKLVQPGVFAIDLHGSDSWKYPEGEMVFTVYSREPPYEGDRANNEGWYRCEIPVDLTTAIKMLELSLKRAWFLKWKLAFSKGV